MQSYIISMLEIWYLSPSNNFCRAIFHAAGTGLFWICLLGILTAALLPRFVVKFIYQYYCPSDIQISREAEKFGNPRVIGGGQIEMHPISDGPRRWEKWSCSFVQSFSSVKLHYIFFRLRQNIISVGCQISLFFYPKDRVFVFQCRGCLYFYSFCIDKLACCKLTVITAERKKAYYMLHSEF